MDSITLIQLFSLAVLAPCGSSAEQFTIHRRESVLSYDVFRLPPSQCRLRQALSCDIYHGVWFDRNRCLCRCTFLSATLRFIQGRWICDGNSVVRRLAGCGYYLYTLDNAAYPPPIVSWRTTRFVWLSWNTCRLDLNTSRYLHCNGKWLSLGLASNKKPFTFEISLRLPSYTVYNMKIRNSSLPSHLRGRLIKLSVTCAPIRRRNTSCILMKTEGDLSCSTYARTPTSSPSTSTNTPTSSPSTSTNTPNSSPSTSTNTPSSSPSTSTNTPSSSPSFRTSVNIQSKPISNTYQSTPANKKHTEEKGVPIPSTNGKGILILAEKSTSPSPNTKNVSAMAERKAPRRSGTSNGVVPAVVVTLLLLALVGSLVGFVVWKRRRGEEVKIISRMNSAAVSGLGRIRFLTSLARRWDADRENVEEENDCDIPHRDNKTTSCNNSQDTGYIYQSANEHLRNGQPLDDPIYEEVQVIQPCQSPVGQSDVHEYSITETKEDIDANHDSKEVQVVVIQPCQSPVAQADVHEYEIPTETTDQCQSSEDDIHKYEIPEATEDSDSDDESYWSGWTDDWSDDLSEDGTLEFVGDAPYSGRKQETRQVVDDSQLDDIHLHGCTYTGDIVDAARDVLTLRDGRNTSNGVETV